MTLTECLAKRHLDTYHVGYDARHLTTLERLLTDVYQAGRGSWHDEHKAGPNETVDASRACDDFNSLGLTELRCVRCSQPAWAHTQPISITLPTPLSPSQIDGAGRDAG